MARPGRPERNRTARSFRQLRRFHHVINSDKVFGTHTGRHSVLICTSANCASSGRTGAREQEGKVAEESTAELLRENLTEYGLVRILAREAIAPELVRKLPAEEAARAVQRAKAPLGTGPRGAKKAKKSKKAARFSKKARNSAPKLHGTAQSGS